MNRANSCGCETNPPVLEKEKWMENIIKINDISIPVVSTRLTLVDIIGGWMVRWGIRRNNYRIRPGLYAVGIPDDNSPVLATANYKLTFDKLRKELGGLNVWILVLDTKGINVWCAAGKGTFGTKELVERIISINLNSVVSHKKIILPQLGAVGVAAHKIKSFTKFEVVYGPVRASDIRKFIADNFVKTYEMRRVNFYLIDRLAVIGIEFVTGLKWLAVILLLIIGLNVLTGRFTLDKIIMDIVPFFGAILTATVLFPALLPWLPFRAFSLKGFILGGIWAVFITFFYKMTFVPALSIFLLLTPITSFIAMNFTGTSTFTSQSGAELEVKIGTPIMITMLALGFILNILLRFKIISL